MIDSAKIISTMLKKSGLKPKDLAKAMNISDKNIYRYLDGKRVPNLKTFLKITDACGFRVCFKRK